MGMWLSLQVVGKSNHSQDKTKPQLPTVLVIIIIIIIITRGFICIQLWKLLRAAEELQQVASGMCHSCCKN